MFTIIAFDYLILTFKVKRSGKNNRYFFETLFPWKQLKTMEHYFSLLVIDRLHDLIQVLLEK